MRRAFFTLLIAMACAARAQAIEFELGAGAKIDVASYGMEKAAALAVAASWLGIGDGLQAGVIAAGSAGRDAADMEASACLRVRPDKAALALFDGIGLLVEAGSEQTIIPILIGGLRIGAGACAIQAALELHYKKTDTDTMLWIALTRRL
jgi:hypothetical protein